jgi:tetratricopeptide (TPR) repeat protein
MSASFEEDVSKQPPGRSGSGIIPSLQHRSDPMHERMPMTLPSTTEVTHPGPAQAPQRSRRRWLWLIPLSLLFVLVAGAVGYQAGIGQREQARSEAFATSAEEQWRLAMEDLAAGRYELASQRIEYVIRIDPTYPDAAQRLAEALVGMSAPRPVLAPVATPTPNLAPVEELFTEARAAFDAGDWDRTIETLLALRAKDFNYRAVEVDGILYAALRNRGIYRIANQGLLEEGMYDLSRAELFGPLDEEADNWRSWADLYLLANSYMGANWGQAVYYFAQVYVVAPYLRNDAYIKYAISAQAYGDLLIAAEDPCAAKDLYEQSLLAWENGTLVPTATEAYDLCEEATSEPEPAKPTATTEGAEPPVETPTPDGGGGGDGGSGDGGG